MVFEKYIPAQPLADYVDAIIYIEGNNKGIGFPKTAMSFAFNLDDNFKLYTDNQFSTFTEHKKYWVAGFQTQPAYVESYGNSKMLVIQFKMLGAYAFLHQPLQYFTDRFVELDCIFRKEAEEVWERLQESKQRSEKFNIATQFLLRQLDPEKLARQKLIASANEFLQEKKSLSVETLCERHAVSRKHLNSVFNEYLGVSPKMILSLRRFQSVLWMISRSEPHRLSSIAYELDYFDQAHFNNNFKRFTGLRPNEYIKQVSSVPSLRLVPHFMPVA